MNHICIQYALILNMGGEQTRSQKSFKKKVVKKLIVAEETAVYPWQTLERTSCLYLERSIF